MKKLSIERLTQYVVEVDAIDSRIMALAEFFKNLAEAPEPWVCEQIGDMLNELVGRRKVSEVYFLGRDEKGLLGVPDSLAAAEIARLEIECPEDEEE